MPWIELTAAAAALSVTAAIAAFVHFHPGPNAVDRLGFRLLPPSSNSSFYRDVTWFGTVLALVIGSVSAATIAWFSSSRSRAQRSLACLVGPPTAAAINQLVIKPQVGRLYVGELSFVSGSVAVIAGVSMAWVLAAPRRIRPIITLVGLLGVVLMSLAVVVLRWHYPTDAIAGALFAVGMVLLIDSATFLLLFRPRPESSPKGRHARHRWSGEPGGVTH
jgi:membrane-associated phospholipid phosphatase